MPKVKIGKVRPTYKGTWDSTLTYEVLDWVIYRGLAYQAIRDVPVNREPDVNTGYWVATGMKGDKGDKGDTGATGLQGAQGAAGAEGVQGPIGLSPKHQWVGTKLQFENPDGTWADATDLVGPQGPVGPEGPVGPQGLKGPDGAQGPVGPQGRQGPKGETPSVSDSLTTPSSLLAASSKAICDVNKKAISAAISGQIVLFSGSFAGSDGKRPIPHGSSTADETWAICDGTNGTPDLRGRFIVGAGGDYANGNTGGHNYITPSVSINNSTCGLWTGPSLTGLMIGGTTLNYATIPSHAHGVLEYSGTSGNMTASHLTGATSGNAGNLTDFVGGSQAHNHAVGDPGHAHAIGDTGHTHSVYAGTFDNKPPYYALSFIMKL